MPLSSSPSSSDIDSGKVSPAHFKRKRQGDTHSDSDSGSLAESSSASSSSDSEDSEDTEETPEISALSHAERRRQKKRESQKTKEDKPTATKKRKLTAGAAPPKRQNSVWVGNLSFKTTLESLKGFFDGVGEITRVHMPMKVTGPSAKLENRGFAYVDFTTPEAKAAAIARSEHNLIGRRLLIKDGDDFTGRPACMSTEGDPSDPTKPSHSKTAQKILRAQKQPPAPTLFLGNLGFEATEKSIRELLDAHRVAKKKPKGAEDEKQEEPKVKDGWIRKVRMGTFEDSGLCKGFAFVDFTSVEHATSALINPKNHHLDGRKLVVEYASADAVRRGGGPKPANADRGAGPRKGNLANRGKPQRGGKEFSRDPAIAEQTHEPSTKPEHKSAEDVQETSETNWPSRKREHQNVEEVQRTYSRSGKDKGPRVRPKPGAALALAKRESAAILPSQGQKITF